MEKKYEQFKAAKAAHERLKDKQPLPVRSTKHFTK